MSRQPLGSWQLGSRLFFFVFAAALTSASACQTDPEPAPEKPAASTNQETKKPPAEPLPPSETKPEPQPKADPEAQPKADPEAQPKADPEAKPVPASAELTTVTATETKRADGEPCRIADDCTSGICEGEGCGDDALGVCAPRGRACTKDLRAYCGCDGKTFRGSGSCPGRRYARRRPCEAP